MTDHPDSEFDPEQVVINDKRRIDVEETRELPDEVNVPDEPVVVDREAELLADLQRVSAEYANYRKRVDRDRVAVVEVATAALLESLLPLLDSIDLARKHGDLEGAFKGVGEGLEQVVDKHGLQKYGAAGEPFDPALHHALVQAPEDPTATVTVVADVLQPGWRLTSGRILRPAGVAVSEPGIVDVPGDPVTEQS